MSPVTAVRAAVALVVLLEASTAAAQPGTRRLTTLEALRKFPGYYHLQNVLLRGEFAEASGRISLRSDEQEMRAYLKDVQTRSGPVEVRAQLVDVGRLDPTDPRSTPFTEGREADRWPKPGEELVLTVTGVAEAPAAVTPSVRALALEPWKFEGQRVTITGNFRGRNLFGDMPDAAASGRYDFVLRSSEGAIWVTGVRPKGKGFDLDVSRRLDTDRWVQVTGTVAIDRGLVALNGTEITLSKAPEAVAPVEAAAPAAPPPPLQVVFSAPTEGDTDISAASSVRIQFSRGLREPTVRDHVRVTYLGAAEGSAPLEFKTNYDAANRAIEIRFAKPLEAFRTVRIELLDGLLAFDGGVLAPWSLTFTVGG